MAFRLGSLNFNAVAQGVGGFVFGSGDHNAEEDDGGVEQLLERISNGVLAEDRRAAMAELQEAVADNRQAQMAFGAMGFPVLMSVFKEDRDDLDMVRGALETLVSAMNTERAVQAEKGQVLPGLVNSELLAREQGSIALILSLLEEDDFYVRYYTLQLLTSLLSNFAARLQEVILGTPQGITRLMDMLLEREVIRNEAILVLTFLTREAEEIQKIVVFEGAFERLFNIIKEEGGSDGGIVVQDCLEFLNNLLRNSASNQIFLRETLGFQQIVSLLKLRRGTSDGFTEQKSVNLLCALETVALLLTGAPPSQSGKEDNLLLNQTVLAQSKILECLLPLCVEGRVSTVSIRCMALRCIGNLVIHHSTNRDILGNKTVGDEPGSEPALVSILRVLLHTSNLNEQSAAEYVFECFCEGNNDGQIMLASTIIPLPQSGSKSSNDTESKRHSSFGSILAQALIGSNGNIDCEPKCRAASVLSHILRDNTDCKELVLHIPIEIESTGLTLPELLLQRFMRYLAATTNIYSNQLSTHFTSSDASQAWSLWFAPVILRLFIIWFADCPAAVSAFLELPSHLTLLVELLTSNGFPTSVHVAGLSAILLGECIVYNDANSGPKEASMVVDIVSQRFGLTNYFTKWDDLKSSPLFVAACNASRIPRPLTRSTAAAIAAGDGFLGSSWDAEGQIQQLEHSALHDGDVFPPLTMLYDSGFVRLVKSLEPVVRERVMELFAHPKHKETVELLGIDAKEGENDSEYIARLRSLLQAQAQEIQDLLERNASLAQDVLRSAGDGISLKPETAGNHAIIHEKRGIPFSRVETEASRKQLQELQDTVDALNLEKASYAAEISTYKNLAAKYESDLQGLSDAYNSLEQENYRLEGELERLHGILGGAASIGPTEEQLAAVREEGRREAQKESEIELNDLLVCLGQEESKVEKLRTRLEEHGEDVDALLEDIGDNAGEDDND